MFRNKFCSFWAYPGVIRLSLKPMPAKCSLNTLGGKPFVSGSASISLYILETYGLILNFIFHNIILYLYCFGSITRPVVVSVKYCGLIVAVHL